MHAALRDRGWIMKHMKINRLMREQAWRKSLFRL